MKPLDVVVIGGGPAGLYFAYLLKKARPDHRLRVYEQNARDATFGFGVVLADRGLERMESVDRASAAKLRERMCLNRDQLIHLNDESILVDRVGYGAAIGRLNLLQVLQGCCDDAGVELHYETRLDVANAPSADLLVGADGANSAVRTANASLFCTRVSYLANHFAWYGTHARFACAALSFKKFGDGYFVAHYYPYSDSLGTFVAECDDATWQREGVGELCEEDRQRLMERIFEKELGGAALIYNKSTWRQFPVIESERWATGNMVLIGDAQQTAHYSIGSGTRVALEDAVALFDAVLAHPDVPRALREFESARRPPKSKLLNAARASYIWYENFPQKMDSLSSLQFTYDFMTRTGRMDDQRLRLEHPKFMARYEQQRHA